MAQTRSTGRRTCPSRPRRRGVGGRVSPTPERARLILDERARRLALAPAQPRQSQSNAAVCSRGCAGASPLRRALCGRCFIPARPCRCRARRPSSMVSPISAASFWCSSISAACWDWARRTRDRRANCAMVLGEDEVEFGIIADEVQAITGFAAEALHDPQPAHDGTPDASSAASPPRARRARRRSILLADQRLFVDRRGGPILAGHARSDPMMCLPSE